MNKDELTPDKFALLLRWLDAEPAEAGQKYETIRLRLIKIFVCRGCACPEELADATIDRVANKIETVESSYVGDPAPYFYGVAKWIHHEHLKKARPVEAPLFEAVEKPGERELDKECLDRCIRLLDAGNRELVLRYYEKEKSAKIIQRRELARRLGITAHALRMKVHRIRKVLEECVLVCLKTDGRMQMPSSTSN